MNPWILAGTTFLASAVEFVEAATIVLAVGITQGWRAAVNGTIAATLALVALVAIFGPLLSRAATVQRIEIVVGPLLVLFGIAWLRKAVWRYAGRKALHDETQIFEREVAQLRRRDEREAFFVAFQGVFVEGLEVAVIVVTFAASTPKFVAWSAGGAAAALVIVAAAAFLLRAPFARVPENLIKSVVGLMLLSLGTFWTGEGLGVVWWLGDTTLFAFIATYAAVAALLVVIMRVRHARPA